MRKVEIIKRIMFNSVYNMGNKSLKFLKNAALADLQKKATNQNKKVIQNGTDTPPYPTPDPSSISEVHNFKFHEQFFLEDEFNGLCLSGIYLPPDIINKILSYLPPDKNILNYSLVCKQWCNIIKSTEFWIHLYIKRSKTNKPKQLAWYVYYCYFAYDYFDKNLLKNGNGQEGLNHWQPVATYPDTFYIKNVPNRVEEEPLPIDVEDFNGYTSCFAPASTYYANGKKQIISFKKSNLIKLIIKEFSPHIYVSEWVNGTFGQESDYKLSCCLRGKSLDQCTSPADDSHLAVIRKYEKNLYYQGRGKMPWNKVEILIKDYPERIVHNIVFQHQTIPAGFSRGQIGFKMAGGVVKILFDSLMEPKFT